MKKSILAFTLLGACMSTPTLAEPLTVEQFKEMQKVWDTIFPEHIQLGYYHQSMTGDIDTLTNNGGQGTLNSISPSATWDLYEKTGKFVVGATLGYTEMENEAAFKGYNARIEQEHRNLYLDAQIQMTKFQKIKPYATLGVGYLTTQAKVTGVDGEHGKHLEIDSSKIMPRVGVGVEVQTGNHWSVGLQYNYQMGDTDLTTTSAYIEFNF